MDPEVFSRASHSAWSKEEAQLTWIVITSTTEMRTRGSRSEQETGMQQLTAFCSEWMCAIILQEVSLERRDVARPWAALGQRLGSILWY